jgi:ubiquilin
MSWKIKVKHLSAGQVEYTVDVDPSTTVRELKVKLHPLSQLAPQNQKIIFAGRILKDEDTLEKVGA